MMNHNIEQEQVAQRRAKLSELRQKGQAYPNDFKREHFAEDLHAHYDAVETESLALQAIHVNVAGRMMTRRVMGKVSFVTLQDMSGQIQLYIARDLLPEGWYQEFKAWDLGDILGAEGELFKTKTGELSVKVKKIKLLTKSLHPLPDKFHGLTDLEQRYRQRYLDLMMNESSRKVFFTRSKMVMLIRQFLMDKKFIEVETPMMHSVLGGAAAKPFKTHHNTLDMDLYMRIAPELFLKRLVVGGFERVFEINRNFRNEGISTRHNPEFTMLEFYMAYATYHDLMDLTEELMRLLAQELLGSLKFECEGVTLDFSKTFARISVREAVLNYAPEISEEILADETKAKSFAKKQGIEIADGMGLGAIHMALFEKFAEHHLQQPTFLTMFPTEVSPLARKNDEDPFVTDRFEFYVLGREIANGFSELNDPEDQAERFQAQVASRASGNEEAMEYDEDYVTALEYGLPPTAGEGFGIDRLAMLFTNSPSIRDVILFPLMRKR